MRASSLHLVSAVCVFLTFATHAQTSEPTNFFPVDKQVLLSSIGEGVYSFEDRDGNDCQLVSRTINGIATWQLTGLANVSGSSKKQLYTLTIDATSACGAASYVPNSNTLSIFNCSLAKYSGPRDGVFEMEKDPNTGSVFVLRPANSSSLLHVQADAFTQKLVRIAIITSEAKKDVSLACRARNLKHMPTLPPVSDRGLTPMFPSILEMVHRTSR